MDDELYEAISIRMLAEEKNMEVGNGRLCQYFVNSSRLTAPWILEALQTIGVENQRKLLTDFLEKNKIDLSDLSSFVITDIKEFEEQNKRYPFDDFEEEYYNIEEEYSLCSLLDRYAHEHLDEFV